MSFRYTNHLVATLKHRLSMEAAHRQLVRQTFTGTCNGVEVTCSAYGTVIGLRLIDRAVWEPHYRVAADGQDHHDSPDAATSAAASASPAAVAAPDSGSPVASATATGGKKGVDLVKLSASIHAATWQAIQKTRSAKEEAHARSLRRNPQLLAEARLRDWYEQDANTLQPRPCDGLKNLQATEWMQAVRFGLPQPARFLRRTGPTAPAGERITALQDADCDPANIPIGSAHPLFTPGLVQLELDPSLAPAAHAQTAGSRVDTAYVLSEQRKEMRRDEEAFWERVELIRRSQLATLPKGGVKRGYADMSATVHDTVDEKVQLRFTQ